MRSPALRRWPRRAATNSGNSSSANAPAVSAKWGAWAILVGGLYLIVRKIISWRVPALMLLTLFACTWLAEGSARAGLYAILSGGVFLAAFFMATDYATSPVTPGGKCIMGVGCGLITLSSAVFPPCPRARVTRC